MVPAKYCGPHCTEHISRHRQMRRLHPIHSHPGFPCVFITRQGRQPDLELVFSGSLRNTDIKTASSTGRNLFNRLGFIGARYCMVEIKRCCRCAVVSVESLGMPYSHSQKSSVHVAQHPVVCCLNSPVHLARSSSCKQWLGTTIPRPPRPNRPEIPCQ